jgi:hypothetical protein
VLPTLKLYSHKGRDCKRQKQYKLEMRFFFKITFMFLALAGIIFAIWKLNTGTGINPSLFYLDSKEGSTFDPSEVTHFEWKSLNRIFSYDRDNHGKWLPEKNEKKLKELLSFLSQIQKNHVEQKGASSLDVILQVKGVRWAGSWDGLSFVWKEGPNAGLGEILNEQKNIVFFKGAHIFDTLDINLCQSRIVKINFQANGKNYQIAPADHTWKVLEPNAQTLNPAFMEKWLIGLCKVKVKSLLDLSYAQSNTKIGAVTFEFINGEKLSLAHVEKDFFVTQETGLILDQLNTSLEDLKKQLQPATNP